LAFRRLAQLTALVTLVTTGIILKGRTDTTTLTLPWRIAVTLAIGAGLALAIVGLLHTLAAEVGARTRLHTLDDIRDQYASVQAYQVGQAAAGRRLQTARTLVAAALGLDPAQVHVGDLRPAAGALLNPEQHLHDHQRGKPAQADLPAFGHRSEPVPPPGHTGQHRLPLRKQEPDTRAETRHHTISNQTRLTPESIGASREVTVLLPGYQTCIKMAGPGSIK
jgi:hypothetical protein